MWNVLNCYLSGRHDFGVWCEPGTIFLRCVHCGKRSGGWAVNAKAAVLSRPAASVATTVVSAPAPATSPRVLPFNRAAAAR